MNDAMGWAFYIAIALVGVFSTVVACVWLWQLLRRHHVRTVAATVIVGLAAVLTFWGLWILFDAGCILAAAVKLARRLAGSGHRPAPESG